jgi:hypothetical protein
MRIPIRWHAEARRLRADGLTPIEIAVLLGRAVSSVRSALGPASQEKAAGKAAATRKAEAKPAKAKPARSLSESAGDGTKPLGAGTRFVEPHAPRVPRVTLDQGALAAAAAAFAAGEIDRAELMRRISR